MKNISFQLCQILDDEHNKLIVGAVIRTRGNVVSVKPLTSDYYDPMERIGTKSLTSDWWSLNIKDIILLDNYTTFTVSDTQFDGLIYILKKDSCHDF